jgi:hypothetical protein
MNFKPKFLSTLLLLLTIGSQFVYNQQAFGFNDSALASFDTSDPLCANDVDAEPNATEETFEDFIASVGQGNGWYFAIEPVFPEVTEIGDGTYRIPADAPVDVSVSIFSPEANGGELRYLFLLDEQLLQPAQEVTVNSEDISTIDIQLPPLTEGVHDLIFVSIPNFGLQPNPSGEPIGLSPRLTLIVGNAENTAVEFTPYPDVGRISQNDPFMFLLLTLDESDESFRG